MNVTEQIAEVRRHVAQARSAGKVVGFVPTLGGMHEGHFSLIRAAGETCGFVVVSIFLNPTQFGPGEDVETYPRTPEEDITASRDLGVDLVFTPTIETMYGNGSLTEITVRQLSETLCGVSRPGHFTGVCTVVAKLFNIVHPDKAFFGAKDFQQGVIIRRMVADMNFPVEIVVCPMIRDTDGLALSTRNRYLTDEQRKQAAELYKSLRLAEQIITRSRPATREVVEAIREHLRTNTPDGVVDYINVVDPETLQDVKGTEGDVVVALAVKFGGARLIDNIVVEGTLRKS